MVNSVGNLSIIYQSISGLAKAQNVMSDLTQQVTTGLRSSDLTDFTAYEARTLVSSKDLQTKSESYQSAIASVQPRLDIYASSLAAIETLAINMASTINNTQNYEAGQLQGLPSQISGVIDQVEYCLNQKVNDRFIYSGTRFSTKPMGSIKDLTNPPTETFPATSPTLPPYDSQAPGSDAQAYTQDSVKVDDSLTMSYGIPSTDTAIQSLVQGLRFAYAAASDSVNYETYMDQAQTLITTSVSGLRSLQALNASNIKILEQTEQDHQNNINLLQNTIDEIQSVDITEVSVQLSAYQTQLNASYASTAQLINLSLLNYL